MNLRVGIAGAALVALAGCGTFHSYRLPMDAVEGYSTFAPIASVAQQMGYVVVEHRDSVNVQFDADIWMQFMVQGTQFNLVLLKMGENKEPPEQIEARFQAAKAKADEIWARAIEVRRQVALPVTR
jgi:hypothetical protein